MRRLLVWIASSLAFGLLMSTQVLACQGATTVFDDKFTTIDPAWQKLGAHFGKIDNNHLLISLSPNDYPETGSNWYSINQRDVYTNANICAEFSFDETQRPVGTNFGIVFWGVDENSFYSFDMNAGGTYELAKRAGSRWLFPIPWTESALIKKGLGQKQELELHTRQDSVELFINGTKVADFKGAMPSGGGTVGITYQFPGTGGKISVTKFQVKN